MGLDSRAATPELVRAAVHLVSEVRSFERAAAAMRRVLGRKLSAKTLERLARAVGGELAELRDSDRDSWNDQVSSVPELAVVACDGGRIRARAAGAGPGVSDPRWRETKNASFERMTPAARTDDDPRGELPDAFADPRKAASIAELPEFSVDSVAASAPRERRVYEGPKRVLRTCVGSMASSDDFGSMMRTEAARRRFFEARRGAFVGDGQAWNWTIWRRHFSGFVPILDFVHAIQYLYAAAKAMEETDAARWERYLRLARSCWRGEAASVVAQLRDALRAAGAEPDEKLPEGDPRRPVADAVRYFANNQSRMDYPRYRRAGLPVTSAPMESLIKQINLRVKGTEMFWNDPEGAEAILQIRAASLCEDDRLDHYLRKRPGHPFVRRTTSPDLSLAT